MSNENEQDLQKDQNEQVDYQSLMDSLIKENEHKEELKQAAADHENSKQKRSRQKNKKGASSQSNKDQNRSMSNHELQNNQYPNQKATVSATTYSATAKKGKFYQSLCPYCGKKVGLFRTWMLKNKGDYFCNECGNHSAVVIDKIIVPMAITAIVLSILLVLLFTFLVDMHIWSIILIFLPFLIFFCASVFLVRLKRIAPPGTKRKKKPTQEELQHTRVI